MRLGIKRKENWSDLKKRIEKDHGVKRRKKRGTAIIFSFFCGFLAYVSVYCCKMFILHLSCLWAFPFCSMVLL